MRLSTKGRYAVMAMTDLAKRQDESDGRAVALAEIASRQQISLSYLEQLFARLRRKGLVISARGPGGGYRLAKAATETFIADIVLAVDEPLRATRCNFTKGQAKGCMAGGERSVVLGFDSFDAYPAHSPHFGSLAGRGTFSSRTLSGLIWACSRWGSRSRSPCCARPSGAR